MQTKIAELFEQLWKDYISITPSADRIHNLLAAKDSEQTLVNDHIALRTFNIDKINLDKLAAHFVALGYQEKGHYNFVEKKLRARHFEYPGNIHPKVFISELLVEQLSEQAQSIIHNMVAQVADDAHLQDNFLYSGRHWQISTVDYQKLVAESEYAAWMSAWGFRANHFTLSVNHKPKFANLQAVNNSLKDAGFVLNNSGGEIKGSPAVGLAQSSTMADIQNVQFLDKTVSVPSCFYEFAERFSLANGELYQGFVAASADKIFESTNSQ